MSTVNRTIIAQKKVVYGLYTCEKSEYLVE